MRLALLVLAATLAAHDPAAQEAQSGGILAATPVLCLAFDAGLGARAEPVALPAPVGPRERAAWRGANRGFLVGLAIGAAATTAGGLYDLSQGGCDYICGWQIGAALSVPVVAITTVTGAVIGSTNASGPVPIQRP